MLTPELTKAFFAHMLKEFDATLVEKDESAVMEVAAALLDALGVQDKEQFMKNFVTTLHKTIYAPFAAGEDHPRWSLWSQARVLCHECQHTVIGARETWVVYDARYLTSSSFRAGYEAECFGTDMEMEWWRLGPSGFDPYKFAQERPFVLKSYGCKDPQIEQAQQMLTIRAGIVSQDVVETKAAMVAIPWLEKNAPGLRVA